MIFNRLLIAGLNIEKTLVHASNSMIAKNHLYKQLPIYAEKIPCADVKAVATAVGLDK